MKINCDGAFNQIDRSGSWGFVLRDCEGAATASGCGRIEKVTEAFHSEVIACLQGLLRAAVLGISNVIVEADALMVKEVATTKKIWHRCFSNGCFHVLKRKLK